MSLTDPVSSRQEGVELPTLDFRAVTFYVGNAFQAAQFYHHVLGFDLIAYRGPETGDRKTVSYLLRQSHVEFIVTSALAADHVVSRHVAKHGDGIKDVAFRVADAHAAFQAAVARGAVEAELPEAFQDYDATDGSAITIRTYGDTTHTFLTSTGLPTELPPGFVPQYRKGHGIGLTRIDHIVGNVGTGQMDEWVKFYENVFGFYVFRHYDESDISTQYSALVSKVVANRAGTVKLPLNEPAEGLKKSQIEEFLEYYGDGGVQHIALATDDILTTVRRLRENGLALMTVPDTYYQALSERVGDLAESIESLKELGILADRDDGGYMLQIFTRPLQDRPTVFFEIIQRAGAEGFGKGNFKALFEAIERDQDRRGNL